MFFRGLTNLLDDSAILFYSFGYSSHRSLIGKTSAARIYSSISQFVWSFIFSLFFCTFHPFHFALEIALLKLSFVVFAIL